ncbi:MAG: hypothetical protein KJ721_00455, partial [Nanoarchaeota archaeon]|nr:hypothetical protein [Nanoarchaeota archaeon]
SRVRGGSRNYEGFFTDGIVCGHKIDEADKEMYRLIKSNLVNTTIFDLRLKYVEVEVDDRTKHVKPRGE